MKCCKKSNQRLEDEQLTMRQEIPESIQLEPQPQNSIVDESPQNGQEEEEIIFDFPVQCWKAEVESLSSDIQLQVDSLEEDEERFWKELIEKYLEPLQNDKEKQEKTKNELQDLRNKINFSFFFLNALWLVAAFVFQVFKVFQIQFDIVDLNLNKTGAKFQVEPMSLMFILGFALSVLLQFFGMLFHRIMTLIHYVAFLETEPKQQKSARTESDFMSNADSNSLFNSVTDMSNISQDETQFDLGEEWDNEDSSLEDSEEETGET